MHVDEETEDTELLRFNGLEDAPPADATLVAAAAAAAARQIPREPVSGWLPHGSRQLEKMAKQSLLLELTQKQHRTYEAVVDWFLANMPATYFRQTTEDARLEHLQAITTLLEHQHHQGDGWQPSGANSSAAPLPPQLPPTRDLVLHVEHMTPERRDVTFIQPGTRRRKDGLLSLMSYLPPADGTLRQVKVFNSKDGTLAINVFGYTPRSPADTAAAAAAAAGGQGRPAAAAAAVPVEEQYPELAAYAAALQRGEFAFDHQHPESGPLFEPAALAAHVARCEPEYVRSSHPRRFAKHMVLYDRVRGTESVAVDVELYDGMDAASTAAGAANGSAAAAGAAAAAPRPAWLTVALANVLPRAALEQSLRLMPLYGLSVLRCHLDVVDDPGNGSVTLLRMLVLPEPEDAARWADPAAWQPVMHDVKRLKWLDERVYHLALEQHPWLGIERAEVVTALANMVYGVLHKHNPWAFSRAQMDEWLDTPRYAKHAAAVADLFMARFHPDPNEDRAPPRQPESFARAQSTLRATLKRDVECDSALLFLESMLDAVGATLRTNFYMPDRYALSLRVDPRVLMTAEEQRTKEIPFGAFFVAGRRFNGFHCRFRDIARGGMRIVTPNTPEQVAIENARAFDEAYGLAFAQQLKNKDIPEGGSKAVVLVDTGRATAAGRSHVMRKSVKAFTDAVLDLIVDTPQTRENVIDYLGKQELLYFGPDEQVIPDDINWIVQRAAQRSYPIPASFMSSKPEAGINHKVYGVTSEGVFVFLDVALRNTGIDPRKDGFSVKLTGGPDGDVAGNMLKILNREYGEKVRVVGVADGTGCAEDPDGLRHDELLRLVEESRPIADFRFNRLGSRGVVHKVDTEEGMRARNSMHARVKADAFVPAGGRPNTVNKNNWRDFLDSAGKPSSPLIVEGANLFITQEARDLLHSEAGVMIVKDSSANKCGVICSSYEIMSAMLMDGSEFRDNKEAIVADVLERLRAIARQEAELLFREFHHYPGALPWFSERISNAINRLTDATLRALDGVPPPDYEELLLPLVRRHLPAALAELAFDRIKERMPAQYLRNAMASCLASHIVYTEGVPFIESQPEDRLSGMAFEYIRSERQVEALAAAVAADPSLDAAQRERVVELLRRGGVRTSLGVF